MSHGRSYIKPESVADAVHIASFGTLGCISGIQYAIPLQDSLSFGPCDADPEKHLALRQQYWNSFEFDVPAASKSQARQNRRALDESYATSVYAQHQIENALSSFPSDAPIVLWSAPTWSDRLRLWWTLDALKYSNVAYERIWLADSRTPESEHHLVDHDVIDSHGEGLLERAFSRLAQIGFERFHAGGSLWKKFSASSPVEFDNARRTGSRSYPELQGVCNEYGRFFPRLVRKQLKLNDIDQFIFDSLSTDAWSRSYDVVARFIETYSIAAWCPARLVAFRLRQWLKHKSQSVLASQLREGVNQLATVAY
ncbi:MAG: hypothetical protein KDB27_04110 [Planctomycetales bacterium]|nr:hypothetical protein [Planctomycetales bacterium]